MSSVVLLRGGGDLASGVAYRLHQAGIRVLITELLQPLLVRRSVAFAEAVYAGETTVEGVTARCIGSLDEMGATLQAGQIPVLVDPHLDCLAELEPVALIDGRMTKQPPEIGKDAAPLVVGLGPGFVAGENCHAVIETMRGHYLGRVLWKGATAPDTGMPGSITQFNLDRVLRAPADGHVQPKAAIGDAIKAGDLICVVDRAEMRAAFDGVLRGLVHPDLPVHKEMKIGDLDPRNDSIYTQHISDKSLAIGGGALEALLARPEIRAQLWP